MMIKIKIKYKVYMKNQPKLPVPKGEKEDPRDQRTRRSYFQALVFIPKKNSKMNRLLPKEGREDLKDPKTKRLCLIQIV